MKRTSSLLIAALFLTSYSQLSHAQNLTMAPESDPVGIGLLFINKTQDLPIYNSQNNRAAFDTIKIKRIMEGKRKGSFEISTANTKNLFNPYQSCEGSSDEEGKSLINSGLGPLEFRLVFRVLKYYKDEFKVIISEKDKTIAIIKIPKEDSINGFETWEHYLKRVAAIEPIGPYYGKGLPVFDVPDGKQINPQFRIQTHIDSVKGNWLRITDDGKLSGWVKWRDNDKVLVRFIERFIE
ncbi:hypothetical protein [Mucilaginibacter sp.]|uniref:hypothetical protein n=1 Tax=Mucilaginibacter sp. TaxID=1882438 RepID=UPI00283ECAD4|nr:hypothetical protein [Mucilaginibacter sp.]MDR3697853.1 hypothetical protein [Mucilaginibacter sp.]